MIIGKLENVREMGLINEKILSKLEFLKDEDFTQYAAGRHEVANDSFFFLNEYETKEEESCFWEAHRKFLDIHFILEGQEKIAFDHIDRQQVKEEYDAEKDAIFLEGSILSEITMNPGDVMICFPEDSHMTGLIAQEKQKVRKVVLKVEL
ncbi:YhcH/YjgK/YiaL family protein [Robertmurraya korlensis]|uniref:YhcH/YjgK/YiaL family protein n=1 Tax=Robertmurraya korlensis TaxID=519977 RepID=UPI0008249DF3|nr:YhcH/YjgK/YiaL family protein [Robertmurraya korlensis]